MKIISFFISLLWAACCQSQLSVNILMPPEGIMDKQQLWNFIATNTENEPLTVQAQIRFSEIASGQTVFVASSPLFNVSSGTTQFTSNSFGSVLYNILNPDYRIDPGPTGLLPVGSFNVCYEFLVQKYNKVVQQCQQINIPPLGSLLLTQPANGSILDGLDPVFSWLPPLPTNSLANLRYELKLVEILDNQSDADAIQNNWPVVIIPNLTNTNYSYLPNLPSLKLDTKYAWQVLAKNNLTPITKSEVWSFIVKKDSTGHPVFQSHPIYVKLRKTGDANGYSIFWGSIRFDYLNETNDNTWNVSIDDITISQHKAFQLAFDTVKMKRGQNLIDYEAFTDGRFINKHQYLLTLINSRNEVWQLRFEYRKPD